MQRYVLACFYSPLPSVAIANLYVAWWAMQFFHFGTFGGNTNARGSNKVRQKVSGEHYIHRPKRQEIYFSELGTSISRVKS